MFLGDARYMHDDCWRPRRCKKHFLWRTKNNLRFQDRQKSIHTVYTIINVLRNGWRAICFVSCFRAHCARKMLMSQEMVCRCGPIAVRSTLKPTSHPYPKKGNVRALTRAAQHLIKPTAFEKWSCSKKVHLKNGHAPRNGLSYGMSWEQACPNEGLSNLLSSITLLWTA